MAKKFDHLKLEIPTQKGATKKLPVCGGMVVFVIGANGSGKSILLQKLSADNRYHARRIKAHRQTWFPTNASDMSAMVKLSMDQQIAAQDVKEESRWLDHYAMQRVNMTLFELIDSEIHAPEE